MDGSPSLPYTGQGGQTVRYYGFYSNATRGRLKKEESQPEFHTIEDENPKSLNRPWARLIQENI